MEAADLQRETATLRRQFADRIDGLDASAWNAQSWCPGWLVRDILAHLVQNAERTYPALLLDLVRGRFGPDRAMRTAALRLRGESVPDLAERLRRGAERHFHLYGSPAGMGVTDVLVHSADAFRPLGLEVDVRPAVAAAGLDALLRAGRMIVHAAPQRGRRLVATDFAWRWGSGPEVRGRCIDLLLLVANRRQVLPDLAGRGLAGLAEAA